MLDDLKELARETKEQLSSGRGWGPNSYFSHSVGKVSLESARRVWWKAMELANGVLELHADLVKKPGGEATAGSKELHRCCKAHTGLCRNNRCPHFVPHKRTIDWRGTGKSCGSWSVCRYLDPKRDNVKVRCI